MIEKWGRAVPVFDVPLWTRPFQVVCALAALALGLVTYRELAGLGPASGMNDAYAWGIWKTFNTMTLTGLGSGGFAVGIAAWLFRRHNLHVVMRTALLTSFLAYLSGLMLLGVDVGRPWTFTGFSRLGDGTYTPRCSKWRCACRCMRWCRCCSRTCRRCWIGCTPTARNIVDL